MAVGDGAVREDLKKQAKDQDLTNLIFTGRRPKEEMPGFLLATDVCFVHLRKTLLSQSSEHSVIGQKRLDYSAKLSGPAKRS